MADDTTMTDPTPYPDAEPDARIDVSRGLVTLADMQQALRAESSALAAADRSLEAAQKDFATRTRRTYFLSDEAHAIAIRDLTPAMVAAEQAAARVAETADRTVRAILAELPAGRMVVDPATEAVAATRAVILGKVIETAPLGQLRDELKAAIVAGDHASMYVYASYLPGRLAAAPAPNEAGRPEIGQARTEIATLLARVRDDLRDTSADPVKTLAAEVRQKAAKARQAANVRKQQAAFDADLQSGRKVAWPSDPNLRAS